MNFTRSVFMGALGLLGLISTQNVSAQPWITPPVNADFSLTPLAPATQVRTGTAVTDVVQFMISDAGNHIDWQIFGGASGSTQLITQGFPIVDPDIVVHPSSNNVAVTYIVNGNAFVEGYHFNGSALVLAAPLTQMTNSGQVGSVNADCGANGVTVFTYEENYIAYANAYYLPTFTMGNTTPFIASAGITDRVLEPDVAINEGYDINSNLYQYALFTWKEVQTLPAQYRVATARHDVNIVGNGGAASLAPGVYDILYTTSNPIGVPRIAAPNISASGNEIDCQIVFDVFNATNDNTIIGMNFNGGNGPFMHEINEDYGIQACLNMNPVVAYAGNTITVNWEYLACANVATSNVTSRGILSRELDMMGDPIFYSAGCNAIAYLRANMDDVGDQFAPSLAGRYSENEEHAHGLWHDANANLLKYKRRNITGPANWLEHNNDEHALENLGDATGIDGFDGFQNGMKVYPNPADDKLLVDVNLMDGETVQSVRVYDLDGRMLYEAQSVSVSGGTISLDLNAVGAKTPGMYLLQMLTSQQQVSSNFIVK